MTHERLLLDHLDVVEDIVDRIRWRNRLSADDADDFRSHVLIKLIEDDYAVLRKFQYRSKWSTYLSVVIGRMFKDHRNHLWGKWRKSAEANRLGADAVRLERLMVRDGHSFDEAVNVLRSAHGVTAPLSVLEHWASRFPIRINRRPEDEVALDTVADVAEGPEVLAERARLRETAQLAREAMDRALESLPSEDRVLVQLFFWQRLTVAAIARMLATEQKPLYRRVRALCDTLRRTLEASGVADEVRQLLDQMWSDFLDERPETPRGGLWPRKTRDEAL